MRDVEVEIGRVSFLWYYLLLPRIWELRQNFAAYDAAYIALAEALNARLITCDRALASAAGRRARVDLIA